jgi:hypothetical protein
MSTRDLFEKAEKLQNLLVARATGEGDSDRDYVRLRQELLSKPGIKALVPSFVRTSRTTDQFWGFIQKAFPTYKERREFLWKEFQPLLDHLEDGGTTPAVVGVSELLGNLDDDHVHELWERALQRRIDDPEGAVTLARSLLESICKTILDTDGIAYPNSADLPKLYKTVAERLKLGPNQHGEKVFKQILGGCTSVVEGLGALRNQLGDAHGKGRHPAKPAARHAELAVNLAGTMATFLVATWNARKEEEEL